MCTDQRPHLVPEGGEEVEELEHPKALSTAGELWEGHTTGQEQDKHHNETNVLHTQPPIPAQNHTDERKPSVEFLQHTWSNVHNDTTSFAGAQQNAVLCHASKRGCKHPPNLCMHKQGRRKMHMNSAQAPTLLPAPPVCSPFLVHECSSAPVAHQGDRTVQHRPLHALKLSCLHTQPSTDGQPLCSQPVTCCVPAWQL